MKRFISLLITLAMIMSLIPVMPVYAAEMSGVRIEYPAFTNGAGGRVSPFSAVEDITYEKSGQRVELISGTANSTSIRRGSLSFYSYVAGNYGAYKIRVPKAGKYNITVEYRADSVGDTSSKMYILPISRKDDIAQAINGKDPNAFVNFKGETTGAFADDFVSAGPFEWTAPQAGEYIVVWVASEDATRINPANLIFDGGTGKAPLTAESSLSKTMLNLAQGEKTTITTTSVTMSDLSAGGAEDIAIITYESSDTNVVTVSGNVITAVGEGSAKIYTKNGDFILAEDEIKVSNLEYSGFYASYPTFVGNGGYASGTLANPGAIAYANSGWRVDGFDYTGTYGSTSPSWHGDVARFMLRTGEYAAYKIDIPEKGFYDVTLEYLVRTGDAGCADMYLLPGDTKKEDIEDAIAKAEPLISQVNFSLAAHTGVSDNTTLKKETSFDIKEKGEHLVVWVNTGSVGAVRPKNLIFDGGDKRAVTHVDFNLSAALKTNITLYLSDGTMADTTKAVITYISSDETLLKIDNEKGKFIALGAGPVTVTANIVYEGLTYIAKTTKTLTGDETLPYSNASRKYMFNKKSADWKQTIIDEGQTEPKANDVRNITYEYTENNYAWYGTTEKKYSAAYCYASEAAPDGRMRMYRNAGGWTGFRITVPERGKYAVHMEYIKYFNGEGPSDVYIIPASVSVENAADYLTSDYYIGTINTLDPNVADLTLADSWIGEVNIPVAGEYAVIFKAKTNSYTTIRSLTLDGVEGMKRVQIFAENDALDVGKSVQASVSAYLLDGTEIPSEKIYVEYKSEHPHIASVSENGVITGIYEGVATVTATVRYGTDISKASFEVTVTDNSGMNSAELTTFSDELYVGGKTKITLLAHMNSGNKLLVEIDNATFEFTSEPAGILSVEDGCLTAKAEGTASVKATVSFRGETKVTNELSFQVAIGTQKNRTTIYTDEMRETALYNAKNYDWARELVKSAKVKADVYLDKIDYIYDMMEVDNLPRSMTAALVDDPDAYGCIYCGIDIRDKYGSYAWGVDPIARPWKIQCPDCKRLFPSNDFESFYKLGKDEFGKFDLARARQLHHEMLYHKDGAECTCNAPTEENTPEWYEFYGYGIKGGYLYNDLYEDVGKDIGVPENEVGRWGVDDGWGYDTGEKASTGVPIRKAYIAFYNFSLWSYGSPIRYIPRAVNALRDAYLYTGDEKYGIPGAILTDRFADVYPTYRWEPYIEFQHSHGGSNQGKISGSIWGRNDGIGFARAYDAFWPLMGHPKVISYLSEKAIKLGLENEKLSAEMIRKNCDDGICREVFEDAKTARIRGNFGSHQETVATAAIALDSMPETEEMIAWLCAPSETTKKDVYKYGKRFWIITGNSGGEMLEKFINEVNRDGFGTEVSALYNEGWLTNVLEFVELFYNYDKDSVLNLYNNPKFRKMFYAIYKMTMSGGYTLQLGEHYSTASTANDTDKGATLTGYLRLGDPVLAQMYYDIIKTHSNPDRLKNIFEKRMATIDEELEDIVGKYGEIELSSENLAGYGLAVLRAGEKIKGSNAKNLKRDTWLWYGGTETSHGHLDFLQIGIDAYGFNFTPDLGYPGATGNDPNRLQWVKNTLSHNTVVVDEIEQTPITVGTPLHFDDAGKVKLVDVEAPGVYEATDIYRRTLVSVQASNEVDYTVDFFRVRGGKEHIYSFHTQSFNGVTTDGLNMTAQNGGTYAGENTEYGNDPNTQNSSAYQTFYPRGYTWLRNVRRDNAPADGTFSVNFKQTDFNKQVSDSKGLNLKWTALNDWTPSSVGIATAEPPKLEQNKNIPELDYMLVHRESNENLDTLFTSVIQPYNGEEYIESMESVALVVSDGVEGKDDIAKAVKVKLKSGRCDYIVYATNNDVTYTLTDGNVSFNFRGFVGVYSVNENGVNIYSYVNDGDIIGNMATAANVSGKVVDFEKEFVAENYITVELDREIDAASLAGRYIYVDNSGKSNGAYRIESAEVTGNTAILDVGDVTLIESYRDSSNFDLGYVYNISVNDKFVIPLSATEDVAPVLDDIADNLTTSANSSISVIVNATSPVGESIAYVGTHMPRGASIDSASGKVTWKPDSSQVGTHSFVITARDDSGRENSTSFEITVYGSTTGDKNGNEETPSTGISGGSAGGGGGGGAAPDNGNSTSDNTDVPNDEDTTRSDEKDNENAPDASGETDIIRFTDLGNHAWASDAINALAADGIIRGTSETTFSPASNITRADFALLLVRAFKLTSDNTENFADVSAADYFATELAVARNNGIISGIGDNKFAPRNTITRQD
ncbi:MAG: S-layer homology domain-containing protein, partial [Oscillospiraceae bacterium]|nr:S-layer homology domain-containing protein [Oscillospiraceae bacterium]